MEHTPPNALLRQGEPCPEHPHVHVSMEPWVLLKGDTHLTCRFWLRCCHDGRYVSAYTCKVAGPAVRTADEVLRDSGFWRAFWWHLTRSGPWYKAGG